MSKSIKSRCRYFCQLFCYYPGTTSCADFLFQNRGAFNKRVPWSEKGTNELQKCWQIAINDRLVGRGQNEMNCLSLCTTSQTDSQYTRWFQKSEGHLSLRPSVLRVSRNTVSNLCPKMSQGQIFICNFLGFSFIPGADAKLESYSTGVDLHSPTFYASRHRQLLKSSRARVKTRVASITCPCLTSPIKVPKLSFLPLRVYHSFSQVL